MLVFGVCCLFFGVNWVLVDCCFLLDLGLAFDEVWIVVCGMLRCLDVWMLVFLVLVDWFICLVCGLWVGWSLFGFVGVSIAGLWFILVL